MNDESLKRATTVEGQDGENLSPKRNRGMFFTTELEGTVSSVKSELAHETSNALELAKFEYAEIKRLFNEKIFERTDQTVFRDKLEDYAENIKFLFELTFILKRIQPYCDFVNDALLPVMESALEKIRLAYGCDLSNHETWGVAQPHTAKICKDATKLACSKLKLSRLYNCVYDEMEWFALSYKSAPWENKRKFFAALNEQSQLLAWVQPFIEIAEERATSWEVAFDKAMASVSEEPQIVEKKIFE